MSTPTPGISGPRQRRERERAEARAAIVAAARELGRTEGWDAVTMRRLADKIEYSANFAYRYFRGRDDILLAVVRDGFERLRELMTAAADWANRRPAHPAAALRRAANAYVDFALAEPELYQLMYGLGGVRVATADTYVEGQAIGDILIGILVDAGDANAADHVLQMWATVHGLIALLAVGRLDADVDQLRALADDAVGDVIDRAVATPARRRRRQAPAEGTS